MINNVGLNLHNDIGNNNERQGTATEQKFGFALEATMTQNKLQTTQVTNETKNLNLEEEAATSLVKAIVDDDPQSMITSQQVVETPKVEPVVEETKTEQVAQPQQVVETPKVEPVVEAKQVEVVVVETKTEQVAQPQQVVETPKVEPVVEAKQVEVVVVETKTEQVAQPQQVVETPKVEQVVEAKQVEIVETKVENNVKIVEEDKKEVNTKIEQKESKQEEREEEMTEVEKTQLNLEENVEVVSEEQQAVSNLDVIAKIKVIGVGGGGNNTIHSMIKEGIQGVDFIAANTDEQALNASICKNVLALGKGATKGLGAGAKPEEGRKAAIESENIIRESLKDANMVIIAAGMGGGTGTGAAPVVAKIAKELGALTVGVVTTPFKFEGTQRRLNADEGLKNLQQNVDSLIVVSNDKLLKQFGSISLKDSFLYADHVLKQSVRSITDLISVPALINLDFADVTTVMKDKGRALIGIGRASGEDRASKAANSAIASPILEASIEGATHAIINISGADITLDEAEQAVSIIKDAASSDVNIIFGVAIDESLGDEIQVAVIATGIDGFVSKDESIPNKKVETISNASAVKRSPEVQQKIDNQQKIREIEQLAEASKKTEVLKESSPKVEVRKTKESTLEFKINFNNIKADNKKLIEENEEEVEDFFAKNPVESEREEARDFSDEYDQVTRPRNRAFESEEEYVASPRASKTHAHEDEHASSRTSSRNRVEETTPFNILDDEEDDLPAFLR